MNVNFMLFVSNVESFCIDLMRILQWQLSPTSTELVEIITKIP